MSWLWFISSINLVLIGLFAAKLYELYRVVQRAVRLLQGCPLKYMALIARRFFFLTQFIRSHGLLLDDAISWIFSSKNFLLASWIATLNTFQLWISPSS